MGRHVCDDERCIDTNELAELINMSPVTLAQWRAAGKGPAFFRFGRHIRYRLSEVRAWIDARHIGEARGNALREAP